MATVTDLEQAVRKALNAGTGAGQSDWAGTSRATLGTIQDVVNLLRQQVIPLLRAISDAQNVGAVAPLVAGEDVLAERATEPAGVLGIYGSDSANQESGYIEDIGVQQLAQAATDEERMSIEAALLVETDNGPHGDGEDVVDEPEVHDGNS